MKIQIHPFLHRRLGLLLLLLGAFALPLAAQTGDDEDEFDEDQPNRLFVEKDWVRFSPDLENPELIEKLFLEDAEDFNPDGLRAFPNLKGLIIKDTEVRDLAFVKYLPNLRVLEMQGNYLHSVAGIENAPQLEEVAIMNNFVRSIEPLAGLTKLRRLRLYDNDITDISPLAGLKNITALDLGKTLITSIEPLAGFTQLRLLSLYQDTLLTDISIISQFTNLNDLNISLMHIPNFSLRTLSAMKEMKNLRIQGMVRSDAELMFIRHMSRLEQLTMGLNPNVSVIDSLWRLQQLRYIDIHSNQVKDISVMRNFPMLVKVVMYNNQVEDITPLASCEFLRSLFMHNNPVSDYETIYGLRRMQYLHLSAKDFTPQQQSMIRRRLSTARISFY